MHSAKTCAPQPTRTHIYVYIREAELAGETADVDLKMKCQATANRAVSIFRISKRISSQMKLLQPLLSNLVLASIASAGIFPGNIRIFRRQDGAETTISFFPGPTTVTVFLEATTATSIEDSDTVLLVSGTTTS